MSEDDWECRLPAGGAACDSIAHKRTNSVNESMAEKPPKPTVFRPRARMILLLGDELIRDAGLAVFELVKNAYDADASKCIVTMENIDDPAAARIIIKDNGSGMNIRTIKTVW